MNYKESLDFLFSQLPMFSRVGAAAYKPGLDTSIALDNHFGNPHRRYRTIHVGGTNGKGSTSHTIAAVLQAQGYRVGLYTSPHLVDFRERMRVNGRMIPEADVVDFVERWLRTPYDGHPSFFELTMMMAFDWFAREEVDYAVIEVGMGGRLDSTNIITPIGSVITNISPDHTQFLGDTLEKIAAEKAGIIKEGVPVVIGRASGGVRRVFESKAAATGSEATFAADTPLLSSIEFMPEGYIEASTPELGRFRYPLGGLYQQENLNTVLHAVSMLRRAGVEISTEALREGLEGVVRLTGLAGRWMVMGEHPFVVADTGHNLDGLTRNMEQLREVLGRRGPESRLRMVVGFVNDKDVAHIAHLLPEEAEYYVTRASVPRAMPAEDVAAILEGLGRRCRVFPEGVKEAADAALSDSGADDMVYIGGSTFIVADWLASAPGSLPSVSRP
ncbi:MAG: bifunctional folylpolyglutamate synthase/dihydrofolate synthase [Bacteroides sp.]|nr:bifunctional folylpolyglutamate synthase/dihydrofolate synthase [Bacteroides sp.]